MTYRKYRCPACRQTTGVAILYGLPSHEAFEAANREEIALGGCCIDLDGPERQCNRCGHQWRIKRREFADDGGHTAQEFYTNRTVVHLMTQLLKPQPGERIYDPTCGTGGMLLSALAEVKRAGDEQRTLRLYRSATI